MWFHWQRQTQFTSMLLSSPRSLLLLKCPTHMHALTVAKISALTVLGCFVAVQKKKKDKQAGLLWCPSTGAEQTIQAQPAAAACACLDPLGIWLCYIWQ